MKIAQWTAAWARPGSRRGLDFLAALEHLAPDIICVTEGTVGLLPHGRNLITSEPDYGYSAPPYRRKVLLWSKSAWISMDPIGSPDLPPGRFVSGVTEADGSRISFVGICIPWKDAHVKTGRKDREPWQDHVAFLQGLKNYLIDLDGPVVVLGDFNQRVPRVTEPLRVAGALSEALDTRFEVVTRDRDRDRSGAKSKIDHIAISASLRATELRPIPNLRKDHTQISDRPGWSVEINSTGARPIIS